MMKTETTWKPLHSFMSCYVRVFHLCSATSFKLGKKDSGDSKMCNDETEMGDCIVAKILKCLSSIKGSI